MVFRIDPEYVSNGSKCKITVQNGKIEIKLVHF